MKRLLCILLMLALLTGCAATAPQQKIYDATFLTLFDTITTIRGYGQSEEAFRELVQPIHDELLHYHQLFDIYQEYDGLANLKTVNDQAGIAPVTVDRAIIELLTDCRSYYELTGGKVNVAMGSVLSLWHEAREQGIANPAEAALPSPQALEEAAAHANWDAVIIDEENATVFLSDPQMSLDVGAVAKGWATQKAAEHAPTGLLLSVGGNICATGPKDAQGTPWVVGVNDPAGGDYLHTLSITGGSVVTSGDYQRYYVVDGQTYHHIIDPDTRFPGTLWRSVTVVCPDSGLADALSTALFLLPLDAGLALLTQCDAQVMWVDAAGTCHYSPGFEDLIRT